MFLDNLKPGNPKTSIKMFHQLRETQEAELILFMLVRQFRIFLQINGNYVEKIDEVKRMAPWQLSKLTIQTKYFTKEQLEKAYNLLFQIETSQKTGKGISSSLDTSIDFFLAEI
jgi:DNA polymerase III delta subunit